MTDERKLKLWDEVMCWLAEAIYEEDLELLCCNALGFTEEEYKEVFGEW